MIIIFSRVDGRPQAFLPVTSGVRREPLGHAGPVDRSPHRPFRGRVVRKLPESFPVHPLLPRAATAAADGTDGAEAKQSGAADVSAFVNADGSTVIEILTTDTPR
jgi:hypothetical protein